MSIENMGLQDVLEYLIPFIFVVFWVVGSLAEGKRRSKERERQEEQRQSKSDGGGQRRPSPLEEIFGMELEEMEEEPMPETSMQVEQQRAEASIRNYEEELEEQKRKINATKARARRFAKKERSEAYGHRQESLRPFAQELVSMLRTPYAVKKAMMSYEILGTPVGMRQDGQMKRSWD